MTTGVQMKRVCLLFATLLLALLCSCHEQEESPTVYYVSYQGIDYTVDVAEQTFSFDDVVCRFELPGQVSFLVIYPDGSTWLRDMSKNKVSISWSDDYDPERYVSGDTLWEVMNRLTGTEDPDTPDVRMVIGLVLLLIGAFSALAPRKKQDTDSILWFRKAQPSATVLLLSRLIGIAIFAAGLICIIV